MKWLGLCCALVLASIATPAGAQAPPARMSVGCEVPDLHVVQSLRSALPLYESDRRTVLDHVRGKMRENSLALGVIVCTSEFYLVDYPDMGRVFIRRTDVATSQGRPTLRLEACPSEGPNGNPNAQKRGGNGAGAPMCRRTNQ